MCLSGFRFSCGLCACAFVHGFAFVHVGVRNSMAYFYLFICGGDLLFWSREMEGWMFAQAAKR